MPYARTPVSADDRIKSEEFHKEWEARAMAHGFTTGGISLDDDQIVWAHRYPLAPTFSTQSVDGSPVAPLMGGYESYDGGVTAVQMMPACAFTLCSDYAKLTRILPVSLTATEVTYFWLVDKHSVEGTDFDKDRLTEFWRRTAIEDMGLCETVQRGVVSQRYIPGPLNDLEADVECFIRWYLRQIVATEGKLVS